MKKYIFVIIVLLLVITPIFAQDEFSDNTETELVKEKSFADEFDEFSEEEKLDKKSKEENFDDGFSDTKEEASTSFDDGFSDNEADGFDESSTEGEFSEFSEFSEDDEPVKRKTNWNRFYWAIGILAITILAGIMVRYEKTRKLKPIFLLASVAILGFYRGGPGVISSFQNTYLYMIGATNIWPAIVLFLGLLPITYLFGKVFCGWICYLGALQEFLYIGKFKLFQTAKAQKIMRIIRYTAFILIIIQLTITQGIEWSKIGPFKVVFNLFSPNMTGYILMLILLISALFIHRPFCKLLCPASLPFGWITKIPGASVLSIDNSCTGCKLCSVSCEIKAITRENRISVIDNQECIMCGECMDSCRTKSIYPFKKSKEHSSVKILKGIKKLKVK